MPLNLHDAFGLPLGAQALALVAFADGAVALATVIAIVGMSALAVRLLGVDVSHRGRIAFGVLAGRHRVEVLRVYARAVAASVIDHEAFWDRLVGQPHGKSVSFTAGSPECDHAVSVSVCVSGPDQTVSDLLTLREKSAALGVCRVAHLGSNLAMTANTATSVAVL